MKIVYKKHHDHYSIAIKFYVKYRKELAEHKEALNVLKRLLLSTYRDGMRISTVNEYLDASDQAELLLAKHGVSIK